MPYLCRTAKCTHIAATDSFLYESGPAGWDEVLHHGPDLTAMVAVSDETGAAVMPQDKQNPRKEQREATGPAASR
jgi:hypothetical protein